MTNRILSDLVGKNVRRVREERGWTRDQLAEHCARVGAPELTAAAITNIELGHRDRRVTVDELSALAEALGLRINYLLPAVDSGLKYSEGQPEWLVMLMQSNAEMMDGLIDTIRRIASRRPDAD